MVTNKLRIGEMFTSFLFSGHLMGDSSFFKCLRQDMVWPITV